MSISSAMNAGVMGLGVNSSKLASISDNIANSETKGYKRADVEFSTLVLTKQATSYQAGGVRANPIRHVDQRGALLSTSNVTDLAIAGGGFLPVIDENQIGREGTPQLRLVTTGSFRPNANGLLTNNNGMVLMGWAADEDGVVAVPGRESAASLTPVQIQNQSIAATPSTMANISVNLPANVTNGTEAYSQTLPVEYYNALGASETLNAKFDWMPGMAPNTWRVQIFDSASAGWDGQPGGLVFEGLMTFSDAPGTGGQLTAVDTYTPLLTNPGASGLAPFDETDPVSVADWAAYNNASRAFLTETGPAFAALGVAPPPTAPNTVPTTDPANWLTYYNDLDAYMTALPGVPTFPGQYDGDTGNVGLMLAGAPFDFNIGALDSTEGVMQLAADYTILKVTKDGSPAANMIGIEVNGSGILSAIYDTGMRKTLYQIPVAMVPNPNGLTSQDGLTFMPSYQSGSMFFYDAGTGPVGQIAANALEESTTDIAQELTQLIKTQRAYSSNAKIIQTADEMMQETTNLKR
jgi:flagellar hook protein FlgE